MRVEFGREHEVYESNSGLPRGNQLRRSGARIKRQGCLRIREVPEASRSKVNGIVERNEFVITSPSPKLSNLRYVTTGQIADRHSEFSAA